MDPTGKGAALPGHGARRPDAEKADEDEGSGGFSILLVIGVVVVAGAVALVVVRSARSSRTGG